MIVTDIKMPNIDGVEVLRHAHQISPDSAVILMTAVDDYEAAVQAVKAGGATDYIRKSPGLVDEVKLAIARALTKVSLSRQNFALRRDAATRNSLDNIIGVSPAHRETEADHPHRCLHQQHHLDLRRKRNRQRTGGPRGAYMLAARRRSLRLGELRRFSGNIAGERTVRLRQGRVHRSQPEPARAV